MTLRSADCVSCDWRLPTTPAGDDQDDATRYVQQQVAPHIDRAGHTVRLTVTTAAERTSLLLHPKEGDT